MISCVPEGSFGHGLQATLLFNYDFQTFTIEQTIFAWRRPMTRLMFWYNRSPKWVAQIVIWPIKRNNLFHTFLYTVHICGAVKQFREIYVVNG